MNRLRPWMSAMPRLVSVLVLWSCALVAMRLDACTVDAWGPVVFVRTTSTPDLDSRTVDLPLPSFAYRLVLDSGDAATGAPPATSADVYLNGLQIFGESDFNATVRHLDKAVTVQTHNTVAVRLRGKPTSQISLRLTATDDRPLSVSFAVAQSSVRENAGTASVAVQLDHATLCAQTIPITVANTSTAQVGADFTIATPSVTFPPGQTAASFTVGIVDDDLAEPTETVVLVLAPPAGVTAAAPATHTLSILDDDPAVTFATTRSSVVEANTTVSVPLLIAPPPTHDLTVTYAVHGTATPSADYVRLPGTLIVPAGATHAAITVTITDDLIQEPDETIILTLLTPHLESLPLVEPCRDHVLTIVDNDSQPTVTFAAASSSISEAGGTAHVAIVLSAASATPVSVSYHVSGTADSHDQGLVDGSITIPAGATTVDLAVPIIDDQIPEPDETVVIQLANPVGAVIGATATHTLSIIDDDRAQVPTIAWTQAQQSVAENAGVAHLVAHLSHASGFTVTAAIALAPTTDATLPVTNLVFPPGTTDVPVALTIIDNPIDQVDRVVALSLLSASNATLGAPALEQVTIVDDDPPPTIAFTAATSLVDESVGHVDVHVALSAPSGKTITVQLAVAGTATVGQDYQPIAGSLTIPPGQTQAAVGIDIIDDTLVEPPETIQLTLTAPQNVQLGAPLTHVLTIQDNDQAPLVSFAQDASACDEAAGTVLVHVVLSAPSAQDLLIPFTVGGTADDGDRTIPIAALRIPALATSADIPVTIIDDTLPEPDETVVLTLQPPPGTAPGPHLTHTLTIHDNDSVPGVHFLAAGSTVDEGVGQVGIPVVLDTPSGQDVTVAVSSFGTATAADATVLTPVLHFAAGQVQATLSVAVIDDAIAEPDEALVLTLRDPVGARLGAPAAYTLTIQDNDGTPTIAFVADASAVVESIGSAHVALAISPASSSAITVHVAVGGTATPGEDYRFASRDLVIPAGSRSASIDIPIVDDTVPEPDESVVLTLTSAIGAALGAIRQHVLTIHDDDGLPVTPLLQFVDDNRDGTYTAFFGYRNDATHDVGVRIGALNSVQPGDADQGQSVVFRPGQTPGWPGCAFSVVFSGDPVAWHLGAQVATGDRTSPRPPPIDQAPPTQHPPIARIVSPADGTGLLAGQPLDLVADAYDIDGAVVRLDLLEGDIVIASATPQAGLTTVFPIPPLALGTHVYRVRATDDSALTSLSGAVQVIVRAAPTIALTRSGAGLIRAGTALTLTALAADADGSVVGVDFLADGVRLGSVTVPPYVWTIPVSPAGRVTYRAVATDNDGLQADASLTLTSDAPPQVAITFPAAGQSVDAQHGAVPLTAVASDPDGTVALVRFQVDGVDVGSATASPFRVDWTPAPTTHGTVAVSAVAVDDAGQATAAAPVAFHLNEPPTAHIDAPADGVVVQAGSDLIVRASGSDPENGLVALVLVKDGERIAETTASTLTEHVSTAVPGAMVLTAEAYDAQGASTASAPVRIIVNGQPVVAFTAPAQGSVVSLGASVPLTVTASSPGGTIVHVELWLDGVRIADDATAPYAFAWTAAGAGLHRLEAHAYDQLGGQSTAQLALTVNTPPTLTLTAPTADTRFVTVGQPVALAATASDPDGSVARVVFAIDGTPLASVTTAPYTATWTPAAAGAHTLSVTATDNLGSSTTVQLPLPAQAPPTVAITAPADRAIVALGSAVSVAIAAATADGAPAQVDLLDGVTPIAHLTAPPYVVAWTPASPGVHQLSARAIDDLGTSATSATVTITIDVPAQVILDSPVAGQVLTQGTDLALAARAIDPDGAIQRVDFLLGDTVVASVTAAPYQATLHAPAPGSYLLRARAIDAHGNAVLCDPAAFRVNALPTVAITAPPSGTVLTKEQEHLIAVDAYDREGIQRVDLLDGQTIVGRATVAPWTISYVPTISGPRQLVARVTDSDGVDVLSAPTTVVINDPPTCSLALDHGTTYDPTVGVTLIATATDSDGTVTKVSFFDGDGLIGEVTAPPYRLRWLGADARTHVLSAVATDDRGGVGRSNTVSFSVNQLPRIAITAPYDQQAFAAPATVTIHAEAQDVDGSIDHVRFLLGTNPNAVATVQVPPYEVVLHDLPSGVYDVIAEATDNAGGVTRSRPVTLRVASAPAVAITAPSAGTLVTIATPVTVSATATGADAAITAVRFLVGTQVVGQALAAPYTVTWTPSSSGDVTLSAQAVDSVGLVTTSAAVPVTVDAPPTATLAVAFEATATVLSATAGDVDGHVTQVRFLADGAPLATLTAAPYVYRWTDAAVGRHEVVAEATDDRGAIGRSPTAVITITQPTVATPTVALTAPVAGTTVQLGQPITLSATAAESGGTIAHVEFYDGATLIGQSTAPPYQFTWTGAAAGQHGLAALAVDAAGTEAVSPQTLLTVNAPPVVVLMAPSDGAVVTANAPQTLTADAVDADGTVTAVEFLDGATSLGTATVRPYTLADVAFTPGTHLLTARATDDRGASTTSAPATIVANQLPTVALTQPTTLVGVSGTSITLAATAHDADGAIADVTFLVNDRVLATVTAAPYTAVLATPPAGTYVLAARARDDHGGSAVSTPVTVRVGDRPTITLSAPGGGATASTGSAVALAAMVQDGDGDTARVALRVDGVEVAHADAAPWSATWTATAGSHAIDAVVSDALGFTATATPVSISVNAAPTVAVTSPTDGASVALGGPVTVTATAADSDGSVASVSFYAGTTLIGTATAAPYQASWTAPSARTYDLTAVATDNVGASTTSAPISFSILDGDQPPVVALTAPTAATSLWAGLAVPLQATASDPDGTVARVDWLLDGTTVVAVATSAPYQATWLTPPAGSHRLVARATDDHGLRTASAPLDLAIHPASDRPTIAITAPSAGAYVAESDVLTLSATGSATVAGLARIDLLVDAAVVGSSTTSPATVDWISSGVGTHLARAVLTTRDGATLAAAPVSFRVIPHDLRIEVTAPASGATVIVGLPVALTAAVYTAVPPAQVEFSDGTTLIGVDPTAPYALTWTPTTAGPHHLTARMIDYSLNETSPEVVVTAVVDSGQPPTVAITDPATDNAVTGIATIRGTVALSNAAAALTDWTLAYAPTADTSAPITIAHATTAVTNAALGVFDTSLLRNDDYTLILSARDTLGRTAEARRRVRVSGAAKVGEFTFTVQDLAFSAGTVPLALLRTYSTLDRDRVGDFGYGWSASFTDLNATIDENRMQTLSETLSPISVRTGAGGRDVTLTLPDGRRTTFTFDLVEGALFHEIAIFRPEPGVTATLSVRPASAGDLITLFAPAQPYWNGTQGWTESPWQIHDFPGFNLTLQDGTVYELAREDLGAHTVQLGDGTTSTDHFYGKLYLSRIRLPSGESIEIDGSHLQRRDAAGALQQQIALTRDGSGRVTAAYDPNRQDAIGTPVDPAVVTYQYSPGGDLITMRRLTDATTTPPAYDVTQYFYEDQAHPHYLTRIVGPNGQPVRMVYDDQGRLVAMIDADGRQTTLTHDLAQHSETIYDRLGNPTTHQYDALGNVTSTTDALGHTTSRQYNAQNLPSSETNALGFTTRYEYDAAGNRTAVVDPLGDRTEFTYDAHGNVLTTKDARGFVTINTYDVAGNLMSVRFPDGGLQQYFYVNAHLDREIDPLGRATSYQYDSAGHVTVIADALGHETRFAYDGNGNQIEMRTTRLREDNTVETLVTSMRYDALARLVWTQAADQSTTSTTYNAFGKPATTTDQLGRVTVYAYDARGNLTGVAYPDGTSTAMAFDAEGHVVRSVDRGGRVTVFQYDVLGRLATTILPDGARTQTIHDAAGRITESVDANGNHTGFGYDAADRRTSITNALRQSTSFGYDGVGNQTAVTDALSRTTTFVYDAMSRRQRTVFPDMSLTETVYDLVGQRTDEYDQARHHTGFAYDALGRLSSVTDPLGNVTRYGYDEVGNQVTQTDALGRITRFAYDQLGRRIARTLPAGQRESFVYDPAGRLDHHLDFNGFTTRFDYDLANRLLHRVPDPRRGEPTIGYAYFPGGERKSMTDASGTTTYAYTVRGQLASKATPFGTLGYRYDAAGNVLGVRSSNTGGVDTTYTYDALNRLATVGDPRVGTTTYRYDGAGNLAGYTYPNGVDTALATDALGRLTDVTSAKGATTLARYTYALSANGQRTGVTEPTRAVRYDYDLAGKLTGETITGSGPTGAIGYVHDAVGNRLFRHSTVANVPEQTFNYDVDDRLTSDQYDANGNTTSSSYGTDSYTFDDRLSKRLRSDSKVVEIIYDGDGNKVAERVDGVTTAFLVDPLNPTGYTQTAEELASDGTVARSYVVGLAHVAQTTNGTGTAYFGYDGHGSVRTLTDASGAVAGSASYDAFGNSLGSTIASRHGYAGEEFVPALAQGYNRARYLDFVRGRFLTADPAAGDMSRPLSLNRYLYASSDPTNRIDPNGMEDLAEEEASLAGQATLGNALVFARGLGWAVYQRAFYVSFLAIANQERILAVTDFAINTTALAAAFADSAMELWLNNQQEIPSDPFERGRVIEDIADPNLGGNVSTIDHYADGVGVSIKSHSAQSESDLLSRIRTDLRALNGVGDREVSGTTSEGEFVRLPPGSVNARVLLVAIPETNARFAFSTSFRSAITSLSQSFKTAIRVVPVQRWRGR